MRLVAGDSFYEELEYKASELSKYKYSKALGLFTMSLKYSEVTIHYFPSNPEDFRIWLDSHDIEGI